MIFLQDVTFGQMSSRSPTGQLVMYKQQSLVHIEFPRPGYPKIRAVVLHVGEPPADYFVDACSGVGTLGLVAYTASKFAVRGFSESIRAEFTTNTTASIAAGS